MTEIPFFGGPLDQNTHSEICGPKYQLDAPFSVEYRDDTSRPMEYHIIISFFLNIYIFI